jgi:hypothetical protein
MDSGTARGVQYEIKFLFFFVKDCNERELEFLSLWLPERKRKMEGRRQEKALSKRVMREVWPSFQHGRLLICGYGGKGVT